MELRLRSGLFACSNLSANNAASSKAVPDEDSRRIDLVSPTDIRVAYRNVMNAIKARRVFDENGCNVEEASLAMLVLAHPIAQPHRADGVAIAMNHGIVSGVLVKDRANASDKPPMNAMFAAHICRCE